MQWKTRLYTTSIPKVNMKYDKSYDTYSNITSRNESKNV